MSLSSHMLGIVLVAALGACSPERSAIDIDDRATAAVPEPRPIEPVALASVEDFPSGNGTLSNLEEIIAALNLTPYHQRGFRGQGLTIAVLDNGFAGLSESRGRRLPPEVKVEPAPRPEMQPTTHGVKLAEIAYALATGSTTYDAKRPGPTILLYNTNGFTNFRAAVQEVAARKVDIVLYAQIWEYGGNADGLGFINKEVDLALAAGVLWVNAAGNLGRSTYGGPVVFRNRSSEVQLPYQGRSVRVVVPQANTPVKFVLAWNDFANSKDYRTPQDLDLIVEDESGQEVAASRLIQSGAEGTDQPEYSAHAREIVHTLLTPGIYHLRVVAKSSNFDEHSRLRLTADGYGVRFLDTGDGANVVLMPADNPRVLTIGAADVPYTSRGDRGKPEADVVSSVRFSDGMEHHGTSAASAIAAGALAVMRSAYGPLSRDQIVAGIKAGTLAAPPQSCTDSMGGSCSTTPILVLPKPRF